MRQPRTSIQEIGASRVKTTRSTLSPSTRKYDRSPVPIILFSTVTIAVSGTGRVDSTLTCTRADAHSSRAHFSAQLTSLFHCGHTALAQGERKLCCAFPCAHVHLVMSLIDGPFSRFLPVTSSPRCSLSRPSASLTSLGRSKAPPCASAHWSGMSGCLANPTPNTNRKY